MVAFFAKMAPTSSVNAILPNLPSGEKLQNLLQCAEEAIGN
jgi:hypothetical protein